jgi:hypothetical protein
MKILVVLVVLSITALSGCVAELFVIRTVEEIKRSDAHAEYTSPKSPDIITGCMMQTLYSHTNAKGARPYAEVTTQTFGTIQSITLRTQQNLATKMYGGGDELIFLIENSVRDGGAKSNVWVNQQFLSPSPQAYLDTLAGVVRVCL